MFKIYKRILCTIHLYAIRYRVHGNDCSASAMNSYEIGFVVAFSTVFVWMPSSVQDLNLSCDLARSLETENRWIPACHKENYFEVNETENVNLLFESIAVNLTIYPWNKRNYSADDIVGFRDNPGNDSEHCKGIYWNDSIDKEIDICLEHAYA